jgi:iron complex outermembrane recepter protein
LITMKYTRYLALILLLAGSGRFAMAAENSAEKGVWPLTIAQNLSEDDYVGEVPRVLTVSRLSQSMADAPSAVTIIDRETIRASGIVDLPEIFRLVPGMYVGTNAGYFHNTNHVVSYHGMSTAYAGSMQVLINGRSVYSPLYGGVQWSELPIAVADIERIEITRGPNAASYGANSFFGAINIMTQNPFEQAGAGVVATHGDGRNEMFFRYASKLNNLSYRFTAGYRDDKGIDNRYDFKRTRLLNVQADYRVNDKNSLEFEFGIIDGNREESIGDVQQDPIFVPRTKDIANHYELIRWRHNVSDDNDFSLQAYHSFDSSDDLVTTADLQPILAGLLQPKLTFKNDIEMQRFDIEVQQNFSLASSLRAVWGGSVRRDTTYAPFELGTNKTDHFDLQRLFGHAEWRPLNQVVLNLGAMVEHNDFTDTNTSPRASINFKLNPNQTIRFGVSSALRTPNYIEEKFNARLIIPTVLPTSYLIQYFADEGNVNPERIVSREIGYLGDFGRISLDARIFNDDIRDFISTPKRTNFITPAGLFLVGGRPRSGVNGGDIEVNGFETQAKWRISKDSNLLLNYAYVDIAANEDDTTSNINESAPRHTISALLTHRFNSEWDASFAYYQTSKVTALGDGNPVDLARRADARLARKFSSGRWKGEVSAVVENLFNEHYEEFADYNTLKRRGRINLRLDF